MEIFGYEFKNGALLDEALTTPSFRMDVPDAIDNQRLEFLGDAVLGLLSAERVYGSFPDDAEGSLTVRRAHMVSSAALCDAANRFGLAERLRRNRCAGEISRSSKMLADAIEAVIGAAYLDGGFDAARQIFENLGLTMNAASGGWTGNPKGELQVKAQAMKPPRLPEYTLLETAGKAHEPIFTVRAYVEGIGEATATAGSRKKAEMLAASKLLAETTVTDW